MIVWQNMTSYQLRVLHKLITVSYFHLQAKTLSTRAKAVAKFQVSHLRSTPYLIYQFTITQYFTLLHYYYFNLKMRICLCEYRLHKQLMSETFIHLFYGYQTKHEIPEFPNHLFCKQIVYCLIPLCLYMAGCIELTRTNFDVDYPAFTLKLKFGGTEIQASILEHGCKNTVTKTINYFEREDQ